MALNGYRTREDRASRLVKVEEAFVTIVRCGYQRYDVYRDGKQLGTVFKLRSRWDWIGDGVNRIWRDMHSTRQRALEELIDKTTNVAAIGDQP